jgi:hypothetical protein
MIKKETLLNHLLFMKSCRTIFPVEGLKDQIEIDLIKEIIEFIELYKDGVDNENY